MFTVGLREDHSHWRFAAAAALGILASCQPQMLVVDLDRDEPSDVGSSETPASDGSGGDDTEIFDVGEGDQGDSPRFDIGEPPELESADVALAVFPGRGDGTFAAPIVAALPRLHTGKLDADCHRVGHHNVITAGFDYDGDGQSDVALAVGGALLVAFGAGAFGFDDVIDDSPHLERVCGWVAGHIFGATHDDLVAMPCDGQAVVVFRGGHRKLSLPIPLEVGAPNDMQIIGLGGGGRDQLAVLSTLDADQASSAVRVFSFEAGEFRVVTQSVSHGAQGLYTLSADDEGPPDLLTVTADARPRHVEVYSQWTVDGFGYRADAQWTEACATCPRVYGTDDLDGDDRADLVLVGGGEGAACGDDLAVAVRSAGAAMPHFDGASTIVDSETTRALATGDVDGDGRADVLALRDGIGDHQPGIAVTVNATKDGADELVFERTAYLLPPNEDFGAFYAFELEDVDGDGALDVVALSSTMGPE